MQRVKIKWGLHPILASLSEDPRKGVIVYAAATVKLLEGSFREYRIKGHIAAGVCEVRRTKIVVVGVYGESANDDPISAEIFRSLESIIEELSLVYGTNQVIIAGDLNVVRADTDTTSFHNRKPRTMEQLEVIIDRFHLTDVAVVAGNCRHT